jgi:hypothetical protein
MTERQPTQEDAPEAEVFLSYSHEDREAAQQLAEALAQQGLVVWWDRTIRAGQDYENEIVRALHNSHCVIVIWTRQSVRSDWVKEEASYARTQGKLIPVLLDDAEIPVPFTLIETVKLKQRDGAFDVKGLRALVNGITGTQANQTELQSESADAGTSSRLRALVESWTWILLPSLLVGAIALILMGWRVPTRVRVDVTASGARLEGNQKSQHTLFSSIRLRSLSVRGLRAVTLPISSVAIANPNDYNVTNDSYGAKDWVGVSSGPTLDLSSQTVGLANSSAGQLTLHSDSESQKSMMVDKISAVGTEIRLMSLGEGEIRLKLVGARISGALMLPNAFTLDTQYLVKDGSPFPYPGPTQRLRLNVMPENNSAQYSGDGSLLFDFELGQSGDHSGPLISSFPIDRIEFEGEARDASTISGQGSISYPECPRTAPVMLQANDVLTLQDLNEFYLREVALTEPATSKLCGHSRLSQLC